MKCWSCQEEKPLSEMVQDKRAIERGWNSSECRPCHRARHKPLPHRLTRHKGLMLRYGISIEDYEAMFKKQSGVCAICKQPPKAGGRNTNLFVDHDHETGRIRGLLCPPCNSSLEWHLKYALVAERYVKDLIS